jgi:hypothetical protein
VIVVGCLGGIVSVLAHDYAIPANEAGKRRL